MIGCGLRCKMHENGSLSPVPPFLPVHFLNLDGSKDLRPPTHVPQLYLYLYVSTLSLVDKRGQKCIIPMSAKQKNSKNMGYTKLFEELIRSSVWAEDDNTRIVWITMLAMKDRHHFVRGTESWLTNNARVTPEACRRALERLGSPDPESHCTLDEGRRIKPVPGGWMIISGEYYAKKLNQAERAEYKASKQAEYRKRAKLPVVAGKEAGATAAINHGLKRSKVSPEDA